MTYGEKIAQLRKSRNMTQGQLGELLNVSSQAVSKWEHDLSEPDLNTIKRISQIFNISIDEFFNLDESGENNKVTIDKVGAEEMTDKITAAVSDTISKNAAAPIVGVCSVCGRAVDANTIHTSTPKVVCKTCANDKAAKMAARDSEVIRFYRKLKLKSRITGSFILIIPIFLIILVFASVKTPIADRVFYCALFVLLGYCLYAANAELRFMMGPVSRVLYKFIRGPVSMPGIIFNLSMDGILSFIVLKIIFAIVGFLLGLLMSLVGIVLACIISPFTFPFTMSKINRKIKGKLEIDDDDIERMLIE